MPRFQQRNWLDVLRASDPDLSRLRVAARATLASGLATLVLLSLARLFGLPRTVAMFGTVIAMNAITMVQDPEPRAQRLTTMLVPLPAVLATVAGTLLSQYPLAGELAFVGVMFASVYVRRFGPRWIAFGTITFMTYFFALFFHAKPAELPWIAAGILLATGVAWLVRFVLLKDRPQRMFRYSVRAYESSIRLLLQFLASAIVAPAWTDRTQRRFRKRMVALNEAALDVETHLDAAAAASNVGPAGRERVRVQVIELELAAERLGSQVRRLANGSLPAREREAIAAALRCRQEGEGSAVAAELAALQEARRALAEATDAEIARRARGAALAPVEAEAGPAPPPPEPTRGLRDSTRLAIQATVSGTAAMVLGLWLSPERWYWAVIAAFMLYNRANTMADAVSNAVERILGTVVGVVAGIVVAHLLHGHPALELVVLFGCVFMSFYLARVSFAWLVLFFTVMLGTMYSLLDLYTDELMFLRLWLTLVGAGAGALTALLVFPTRPRLKVRAAAAEILRAAADYLEAALFGKDEGNGQLVRRMRQMDRKTRTLRELTRPLRGVMFPVPSTSVPLVHATSALVFFARQFASCTALRELEGEENRALQAAACAVITRARSLADDVERGAGAAKPDVTRSPAVAVGPGPAIYWVSRMGELLDEIAELVPKPPTRV